MMFAMLNDGLGGLAMAIGVAMIVMATVVTAAAAFLGWLLTRKMKSTKARAVVVLFFATLGLAGGVAWVAATFYESTFDPPTEITFVVPDDFEETTVIVIQDPDAQAIELKGYDLPFMARRGEVLVSQSGVARVRNWTPRYAERWPCLSDGRCQRGASMGNLPGELGGYPVAIYDFTDIYGPPESIPYGGDELNEWLRTRLEAE